MFCYYNYMTLGAKSSQSKSHITTIIQNFTLVSLTSTVTLHLVGLLLRAMVPSLPMYSSSYIFDSLRTHFPAHLSHRYINVSTGRIFCLGIFVRSSTCSSIQFAILDCWSTWQKSWVVGWIQLTLLSCVVVSLVISICWSNWLDDKRSPLVCYQDKQSN